MSAPNAEPTTSTSTTQVIGRLFAGYFLNDFKEGGRSGPQIIQFAVGKAKKWLGEQTAREFFQAGEPSHKALIDACVEYALLDKVSDETTADLKKLDAGSRITIELVFMKSTGRDPLNPKNKQWVHPLWSLKRVTTQYAELSPTNVTPEELCTALKEALWEFCLSMRTHIARQFA